LTGINAGAARAANLPPAWWRSLTMFLYRLRLFSLFGFAVSAFQAGPTARR